MSDARHQELSLGADRPLRLRPAGLVFGALSLMAICLACYIALNGLLLSAKARDTPGQAQFFASAIEDALTRLSHLPFVLSIDPLTLEAIRDGQTEQLNPILESIAEKSGAEFVYVMDLNGQTIASSNYAAPDSLVGNFYTFRPYFREAIAGGSGTLFAVGVTTGRPGYFISEPVRDAAGTIFGVVVVKIGFSELARALADSGEVVLVTNHQGVVIISSQPELVYGMLSPLDAFVRRQLEDDRQFGDKELFALDWTSDRDRRARLDGTNYLWTQTNLVDADWTVHLLSDLRDIRRQALLYVAIGVMAILALSVAAALYRSSQLRRALLSSDEDRRRLVAEIEERKRAEARLATARKELARQNQLAALGQLSVSITHELGQPISAMRNYLVAEEIAQDAAPGGLFPEISRLVDRMQRLLNQLRLFGRTDTRESEEFVVQDAIRAASQLVGHTAREAGVEIAQTLPEASVRITGQSDRFEQVVVNLLRNAIDAVAGVEAGAVSLALVDETDGLVLEVSDNGHGLGALSMDDLREPFFSTKPSGQGMGLGLAISAQIINEMGGEMTATNNSVGGATFTVRLSKAETAHA